MRYSFGMNAIAPENPASIKGASLDDSFLSVSLDRERSYPWHKPVYSVHYPPEEALDLPSELWLNTGAQVLDFDIRVDFHGLMLSEPAVDLLAEPLARQFKSVPLNVVNRKGEPITRHKMTYAKPLQQPKVWDDATTQQVDKDVVIRFFPVKLRQFESFGLRTDLEADMICPFGLDETLLLKRELAETLQDAGLRGLDWTDQDRFMVCYNDRLARALDPIG